MAKNLKLNIKNTQLAKAIDLGGLKNKLAKKVAETEDIPLKAIASPKKGAKVAKEKEPASLVEETPKEETRRVKAKSHSAFGAPNALGSKSPLIEDTSEEESIPQESVENSFSEEILPKQKSCEELRKELFGDVEETPQEIKIESPEEVVPEPPIAPPKPVTTPTPPKSPPPVAQKQEPLKPKAKPPARRYVDEPRHKPSTRPAIPHALMRQAPVEKLGPTGRHIKDLLPPPPPPKEEAPAKGHPRREERASVPPEKAKGKESDQEGAAKTEAENSKKGQKPAKTKEFRDLKPTGRKQETGNRSFDTRDRQGLRGGDEDGSSWRKRRPKQRIMEESVQPVRPTTLKVRIPIMIKDLASDMKLKASQLIAKLFMQGVVATLNDYLEDETAIQLLGQEFGCDITIDTAEEQRVRVTSKTIREEIAETPAEELQTRPPIVAFMGHVDHGKTSLIDYIRKSNRAAGEAGAITQHIGAFKCHTAVGDIAILDTPGHEAFSAMRARGADVTDIVVLVVAGDEGIRQQTLEAIQHAKAAKVTIVVALNKCDKPGFDSELVYRQLSEQDLLPEAWGGQIITVNCSAATGEGIQGLLEMLALQAEVLELKANPSSRARGSVLESEMHKGMGAVATVLVQNGSLKPGDALVFGQTWGRVKTMRNEFQKELSQATPSTPVEITGLSGLPEAGEEFIVVKNEKEARNIAEKRMEGIRLSSIQLKKKLTLENLFQHAADGTQRKILNVILRADVQGSLEALKVALMKIESTKAALNIIFAGVGEISESDVQLAAASKAVIIGFHTQIESHAENLMKQLGVQARLHDIIYHAIDDAKILLAGMLDKIAVENEKGKVEVKATFKSSQYGIIAGCQVIEGVVVRNCPWRLKRGNDIIWKGTASSLKRIKEDVREVAKGLECGIVLNGFSDFQVGDILECYEINYITQEL